MKNLINTFFLTVASLTVNAQSFVAGWDFDGVNQAAASSSANWGSQAGAATLSWTHSPANPPFVFTSEFGISASFNDTAANDAFGFSDPTTGFTAFSQNFGGAEQGFQSITGDDSFTLNFSAANLTGLELTYAYSSTGSATDFNKVTVDLSSLDGVASASHSFTPTASGLYDNFAITGTVVPEPSSFAVIAGVVALGFAAVRRRS